MCGAALATAVFSCYLMKCSSSADSLCGRMILEIIKMLQTLCVAKGQCGALPKGCDLQSDLIFNSVSAFLMFAFFYLASTCLYHLIFPKI